MNDHEVIFNIMEKKEIAVVSITKEFFEEETGKTVSDEVWQENLRVMNKSCQYDLEQWLIEQVDINLSMMEVE